jgi:UDP-4-amino-4,6-dideoxy-N-acetyl-beta-L-altrosamine transaminase
MASPIPYSRQDISDADIAAVTTVLRSPFLTQGPAVPRFEADLASIHGVAHGVAVSNATAGLHIACQALGAGSGSLVWTSPNSFVASANCARYCGADVDFVDIDPRSRNMSVGALAEKLAAAERAGRLPDIVIPVDFAGYPCDWDKIRSLADRYGFRVIADSSHAVGAKYDGRTIGRHADITILSEGGACLTDDDFLAQHMRRLRSHGITRDASEMTGAPDGPWYYEQIELGYNFRMTDIQAALGSSQLTRLDERAALRDARAARYDDGLSDLPLLLPMRANDRASAHHLYVIELDETRTALTRAEMFDYLRGENIAPNVHYFPIHLQPYYRRLGFSPGDFPNAERYYSRALTIPLYPTMTDEEQDHVIAALQRAAY